MKICIYKITNLVDGKVYIGQTINYPKRKRSHISHLINGKHHNEHLQNAWDKYGEDKFEIEIIEECTVSELDMKEKHYIDLHNAINSKYGYNLVDGGQVFRKFTLETRKKMSNSLKGRVFSEIHKQRISKGQIGKEIKQESIEKQKKTAKVNGKNKGQKNSNALISNKVAKMIIMDLYDNIPVSHLVERYQVSQDTIYGLMYNKSYIDILPEIRGIVKNRTTTNNTIKIQSAIEMYKGGMSQNKISKELNISRNTLRKTLKELDINTKIHINQYVNTEVND